MAFLRLRRDQQRFFLNNKEVKGIVQFDGAYAVPRIPFKYLGLGEVSGLARGVQAGRFTAAGLVIQEDPFVAFTGTSGFNVYVVNSLTSTGLNYSLTSGYLVNYQSRCSVGQIPQYQVDIAVFGNIGRFTTAESLKVESDLTDIKNEAVAPASVFVAGPGTIALTLDEFNTNRVISYDLSIAVPRAPVYALGSRNAIDVQRIMPLTVDFRANIEVDDYAPKKMRSFPCSETVQNVTLTLRKFDSSYAITTFSFSDMRLVEEQYQAQSSENVIVALNYRTYLT